jgi:hypothetical protein
MHALRSLMAARCRLFAAVFACALALRLAVPAGWMPVAQADGWVRLAICPGAAAADPPPMAHAMHGDAHGHASQHDHDRNRGDHAPPCAFTGLALAAALPDLTSAPPALSFAATIQPVRQALVSVGRGLAAPPPPQTGPPSLA